MFTIISHQKNVKHNEIPYTAIRMAQVKKTDDRKYW